jgi:glycosyltransferase involved in cell wall biosynthesis
MISVTVPVHNEQESLGSLHAQVRDVLTGMQHPWEIIFVNDGSTDDSGPVLDQLASADSHVKVIHLRRNYGQTAAMMAGFDYAHGDVIVPIDADLQNDPADIPRLLNTLDQGFDVCSGWRKERKDAIARVVPSWIANRIISVVSGVPLHDYGCTLKAYRRDVIKDIKLYGEMHRFVPIYASWQGARVTEIPVSHHPRRFGSSKYGFERTIKIVLDLLVVKFLSQYAQKPMYVFGAFGLLNLAVSAITGAWAVYLKLLKSVSFIQTPLPYVSIMLAVLGIMCLLMGLLAELLTRTYHESQNKSIYEIKTATNVRSGDSRPS